jgi:hypothetical protein
MQKYVLLKESDQLTPQIILVYTDTRVVSLTSLCGVKSDEAERFQAQLDFVRIKKCGGRGKLARRRSRGG